MRPPVALLVSGPPASGKSSASPLVAGRRDPSVCIESDWYWSTITKGFIQPWLPESAEQSRVVASAYAAAAARMAVGGYFVVLDGVVGPWLMPIVEGEFERAGVDLVYVILRPTREVALSRGAERAGQEVVQGLPALSDPGPIGQLWDVFSDLGPYEPNVIDNTLLDPAATATAIWEFYREAETAILQNPPHD